MKNSIIIALVTLVFIFVFSTYAIIKADVEKGDSASLIKDKVMCEVFDNCAGMIKRKVDEGRHIKVVGKFNVDF